MPPSAMTGTPAGRATLATWNTAVACPLPTAHTCAAADSRLIRCAALL